MNNERLIPRTSIDLVAAKMLRQQVGRGKRWSVVECSQGAGVPERKIEAALAPLDSEHFRPLATDDLLSLMSFLGLPAQNMVLALIGSSAVANDDADVGSDIAIIAMMAELSMMIARANAPDSPGGARRTHMETAPIAKHARVLVPLLQAIIREDDLAS